MNYNLTDKQKELARGIVTLIRAGSWNENFTVIWMGDEARIVDGGRATQPPFPMSQGGLDALFEAKLLVQALTYNVRGIEESRRCTITGRAYLGVDSNFTEEEVSNRSASLDRSHPPEIVMSLDRFRNQFPDPKKVGFLIMRFASVQPYTSIVEIIKETARKHGLMVVRADEGEYHADLLGNVRTYLHGCGFGIAIYERIETDEPNANIGLEVGYLMAMNKPVLLLKDQTLETLQTDLTGRLYKPFNPHDPQGTIPGQMTKWLKDYGIVVL